MLADGHADMVSLARPMLADPDFVAKAAAGRPEAINTCIGCNQACLDHTFSGKITSCLVNPRACHETELIAPTPAAQSASPVTRPAGLACAVCPRPNAATTSPSTTPRARSAASSNVARKVPGKQEFDETIRYFRTQLELHGVNVRLNTRVAAEDVRAYDEVVVATGVTRAPHPGVDHPSVLGYLDVQHHGDRVAILGAGGIGFDVAEYLTDGGDKASEDPSTYFRHWGVDMDYQAPGGLAPPSAPPRRTSVHLLQRKASKVGTGLSKTTGYHRTELKHRGVTMVPGAQYDRIDDAGLHVTVEGHSQVLRGRHRRAVHRPGASAGTCTRNCPQRDAACTSSAVPTSRASWTPSAPSSRARSWRRRCDRPSRRPERPGPRSGVPRMTPCRSRTRSSPPCSRNRRRASN